MLDYEKAAWSSLSSVFPDVERRGCAFHFTQALWRHITMIGLTREYREDGPTKEILKEMLSLHLMPLETIRGRFAALSAKCTTEKLREFADYVEGTWINTSFWPPEAWCVYNQRVRTNNALEGWHCYLNSICNSNSQLYIMIECLHGEARQAMRDRNLIRENLLTERNHAKYVRYNDKLFALWDEYQAGETLTPAMLLKRIAQLKV